MNLFDRLTIRRGVTRTVVLTERWALKIPGGLGFEAWHPSAPTALVRGWLANQSEWRQRRRPDVARPLATLAHLVLVMPRADLVGDQIPGAPKGPWLSGYSGDEAKPSSWGWFGGAWKLIDFDRAWEPPYGLVADLYYAHQAALARRWMELADRPAPAAVDER